MADKTIRENFFDAKAIGSLWDVAVSLKRGNPLPIDADSVFESEAKLIEYIGDKITTVAYPGQVVAVVNADSTQIFYIDQNLDYHAVGSNITADGTSIKVDNNVLSLAGFDTASDGLLAQVKVDAEGNRSLNWVSIETIAEGDGNTTYTFTGLDKESNVYFEVKASDADTAAKIYLDAYTKSEIDTKFQEERTAINETIATEIDELTDIIAEKADKQDLDQFVTAENVSDAITLALGDYYNKTSIDETVEDLESKISAIPKFAIQVATPTEDGTPDVETPDYTTVYLVTHDDETTTDIYDEYIYIKVDDETSRWELLGRQKLDLSGFATSEDVQKVQDELDLLEEAHNALSDDVSALEEVIGNETDGLVADVANLTAAMESLDVSGDIADAIGTHLADKEHLSTEQVTGIADNVAAEAITTHTTDVYHITSEDVATQINNVLATEDYASKIAAAKEEAIAASLVKEVDEDQFTVTDGKLTLDAIAIDKVTGLAELFAATYSKTEVDTKIEEANKDNVKGITVNGLAITAVNNIIDIPAATASVFGAVKLGNEFKTAEDGSLEVNTLNVNKLTQTEGDVLILDGGIASNLLPREE